MKTKFKILHVGKFFPPYSGGIEYFLADLVKAQSKLENQVWALVHGSPLSFRTKKEKKGDVLVFYAPCWGQVFYAPLAPSFPWLYFRLLSSYKPDIIHLHLPNTSAFSALLFSKLQKGKVVLHWHADVVPSQIDRGLSLLYRFYRPFERALIKRADLIVATSPPYLETSKALAPFRFKTKIIPLGLDPSRLYAGVNSKKGSKIPLKSSFVLSVGRFTYYKGFEYLLSALEFLPPEVKLCLVGHGKLKNFLLEKIKKQKLKNRVFLFEQVEDEVLHKLFASCVLFCLPSIERTEAFGLVLLEAMVFGKPLVTTSVVGSGMNWVNVHGKTGLVVPPAHPKALAEAIYTIFQDPSLAQEMGRRAKRRFEERFHIQKVAQEIQKSYLELF